MIADLNGKVCQQHPDGVMVIYSAFNSECPLCVADTRIELLEKKVQELKLIGEDDGK